MSSEKLEYGEWEYHPIYGACSRIVYRVIAKDRMVMLGREYKPLLV